MSRPIKFRAWDEQNEVMHFDFQFIRSGVEANDWIVFKSDKHGLYLPTHPFTNPYFSQQLKIMQYTGLHDKNGKEGYHKDIVQSGNKLFTIEWQNEEARFLLLPAGNNTGSWKHMDMLSSFEIIGNIWENSELLNKKASAQTETNRSNF